MWHGFLSHGDNQTITGKRGQVLNGLAEALGVGLRDLYLQDRSSTGSTDLSFEVFGPGPDRQLVGYLWLEDDEQTEPPPGWEDRAVEAFATELASRGSPRPVCTTCNDTHMMELGDREVMCTRCPVPCEQCRSRGPGLAGGPYCAATPCGCGCHQIHTPV